MKCMTKYVALDVHQATTVASVRAEGGRGVGSVIWHFLHFRSQHVQLLRALQLRFRNRTGAYSHYAGGAKSGRRSNLMARASVVCAAVMHQRWLCSLTFLRITCRAIPYQQHRSLGNQ